MPRAEVGEALAVWLPDETTTLDLRDCAGQEGGDAWELRLRALPEEAARRNRLLETLDLRERCRERAAEEDNEEWELRLRRVRDETAERLDEAILRGLRRRVGRWLGSRSVAGLAPPVVADHADKEAAACELLMKLGGALPREIGVCGASPDPDDLEADRGPGCGYIWERSNRKNLAVYCPDCTRRQEAPGVEWREDGSYLVRPIQPLRRLGFAAFGVQPCVVCGLRIDVKKLRDEAYCSPNCRQRAHRRRAAGVPIRDARESTWIDMERTMAPDAHIRRGTCAGCGADYSTVTDSDLCPRCVDVEAGHQEYLPRDPRTYDGVTGVPEGWNGITQPPDVAA